MHFAYSIFYSQAMWGQFYIKSGKATFVLDILFAIFMIYVEKKYKISYNVNINDKNGGNK